MLTIRTTTNATCLVHPYVLQPKVTIADRLPKNMLFSCEMSVTKSSLTQYIAAVNNSNKLAMVCSDYFVVDKNMHLRVYLQQQYTS